LKTSALIVLLIYTVEITYQLTQ